MTISQWSSNANQNTLAPPNGAPEGMAPSAVNNVLRQIMADVRADYEGSGFKDLGHTPTYSSSTSFLLAGDLTSFYTSERPIKITDATAIYGHVVSSTYSNPNTVVTVSNDNNYLTSAIASVAVGILDPTYKSISAKSARYLPAGTGAVATEVETKLRDFVSLRDIGVLPTASGSANYTNFMQLISNGARRIYAPAGTYNFSTTPYLSGVVGFVMFGDGISQTVFKGPGGSANAIEFKNATTRFDVSNMSFDGNGTTGSSFYIASTSSSSSDTGNALMSHIRAFGASTAIRIATGSEITFDRCEAAGTSAVGSIGLWADGSNSVNITWREGAISAFDKGIQNMSAALSSEAQIKLAGNCTFSSSLTADIYSNYVSYWDIESAFTENSKRFLETVVGGSGSAAMIYIKKLNINTITAGDFYAIYLRNPCTLKLQQVFFSQANQKVYCDDNRTRIITEGSRYVDSAPFSGCVSGTYISYNGDVINGSVISSTPSARITKTSNQSLTTSVADPVTFDSESYDDGGFHVTSGNTERFTIPAGMGGLYMIKFNYAFDANATGVRQAVIWKNGLTSLSIKRTSPSPAGEYTVDEISTEDIAIAGDYYYLSLLQASGGALNVIGSGNYTTGHIIRLGPTVS